ncbi:MAG: helix-turn-helix transcriptional regulator [Clostridiales bacterium]|nr:helix-turn-helix transcriptional regulator [Clostridiales bacterium]
MNDDIGTRISELIASLGIKKVRFAEQIKVDQSYVTQLTSGKRTPSDRTIADICREFNVSEHWLRTGDGPMYVEMSRSDEIAAFMGDVLSSSKPDFRQTLISVLTQLDEHEWEALESITTKFMDTLQKEKTGP